MLALQDQLGTTPASSTPLIGYSDVVKRLDDLFDAVNGVRETLLAVYSKKKSRIQPIRAPRPQTAYQRLKKREKVQKLQSIEDKMLGGR